MESPISFLLQIIMATALAGLIGLEREMHIQDAPAEFEPAGLRSFAMIGILGFLGMYLFQTFENIWFLIILFLAVFGFSLVSHTFQVFQQKENGITSELSSLASFLIGVLVAMNQIFFAITVSILFTSLLALKKILHGVARNINHKELLAILQFLLISFVTLQVMPSSWVDPWGFFDWRPRLVWLMVTFVAAIRFIGYFLSKIVGVQKRILLSGIIGGFLSSTAVTTALSLESRNQKQGTPYAIAILIASGIMFFRVIFEISFLSPDLLSFLVWPLFVMGIVTLALVGGIVFFQSRKNNNLEEPIQVTHPFELRPALIFGAFFLGIVLLSEKIQSLDVVANAGLLVTGGLAGLTDVDAITLAMANLSGSEKIAFFLGAQVIFLAVVVNTIMKMGIVYFFGSRSLFWGVVLAQLIVLGAGGITLYFIL
ncbi:MgtC/SapB family protein [Candidatus Peregrinibacteria bacterium]|nr:MgtC/SapB family protein [Candidatus Peregrinibacteria bacterium]